MAFLLNRTSVDDARQSIQRCNSLKALHASLEDECRNGNGRKVMVRMLETRIRKLEKVA